MIAKVKNFQVNSSHQLHRNGALSIVFLKIISEVLRTIQTDISLKMERAMIGAGTPYRDDNIWIFYGSVSGNYHQIPQLLLVDSRFLLT